MNQPSATITAATLAGMVMVAVWGVINVFVLPLLPTPIALTPDVVAVEGTVTTAVVGWVGYKKKETVYPEGWKEGGG